METKLLPQFNSHSDNTRKRGQHRRRTDVLHILYYIYASIYDILLRMAIKNGSVKISYVHE